MHASGRAVIDIELPPLDAAEVARRVARATRPFSLSSPGASDTGCALWAAGCDPETIVRGSSVDELAAAWDEARARWRGAPPGVPVGVGYLSYDLGRRLQPRQGEGRAPTGWPDLDFGFHGALVVARARDVPRIVAHDREAADRLRELLAVSPARAADDESGGGEGVRSVALRPMDPDAAHLRAIARALDYIRAGDVYQVNLARRLVASADVAGDAGTATSAAPGLAWFLRLQAVAPAPHAFWLADREGGAALVGNSPERFLALDGRGGIETRPIKGTRPRGGTALADGAAAAELLGSAKDRAEHVMIIDLERNDLGRVCRPGTVAVTTPARLVSLPTVHHLVSTVEGRLRPDAGLAEILRATFPGGSVTGAPKIRAMQVIDELEPARRGPYCGATGWLGAAGDLELAVAIRTALVREGALTLWVGGGVVADSDPGAELAETDAKAAAFARALR